MKKTIILISVRDSLPKVLNEFLFLKHSVKFVVKFALVSMVFSSNSGFFFPEFQYLSIKNIIQTPLKLK